MRFECLEVITSTQKLVYRHIARSAVVPACSRSFVPSSLEVKVFETRLNDRSVTISSLLRSDD